MLNSNHFPFSGRGATARRSPAGFIRGAAALAFALAPALALVPARRASAQDLIGGGDAIPINPNFRVEGADFFNQIVAGSPPTLRDLILTNFSPDVIRERISPDIQTTLGAALSQAISSSNRPSVLTPYAGILGGEGESFVFDSFGSLVTNKASTIGKGNFGLGVSYQHSRFKDFNGAPIGDFASAESNQRSPRDIIEVSDPFLGDSLIVLESAFASTLDVKDVEFTADVVTIALTYGLMDHLDVGALVPLINLRNEGNAAYKITQSLSVTQINELGEVQLVNARQTDKFYGSWDRDYSGPGDVILFAKQQLMSQAGLMGEKAWKAPLDLAATAELKLPTGDENKFLGTGKTDFALRVIAQREIIPARMRARAELGYNISGLGSEFSSFDYKFGMEYVATTALAFSGEVIGSRSDAFHHIVDGVLGAKYNFPHDVAVFGGFRFPISDNGLRFDWAPIIGVEKTFVRPFERKQPEAEAAPTAEPPAEGQPAPAPAPGEEGAPEFTPLESAPAPAPAPGGAPEFTPIDQAPQGAAPAQPAEAPKQAEAPKPAPKPAKPADLPEGLEFTPIE